MKKKKKRNAWHGRMLRRFYEQYLALRARIKAASCPTLHRCNPATPTHNNVATARSASLRDTQRYARPCSRIRFFFFFFFYLIKGFYLIFILITITLTGNHQCFLFITYNCTSWSNIYLQSNVFATIVFLFFHARIGNVCMSCSWTLFDAPVHIMNYTSSLLIKSMSQQYIFLWYSFFLY